MSQPGIATKRPVDVEFRRWEGGAAAATPIIDWILTHGGTARWHEEDQALPELLHVDTMEGTMNASPGDVIIRGVNGEFYPCKPDVFEKTYDVKMEPTR